MTARREIDEIVEDVIKIYNSLLEKIGDAKNDIINKVAIFYIIMKLFDRNKLSWNLRRVYHKAIKRIKYLSTGKVNEAYFTWITVNGTKYLRLNRKNNLVDQTLKIIKNPLEELLNTVYKSYKMKYQPQKRILLHNFSIN